ncbi:MAG: Hsp20/alpha crystallin family protein [Chloroflexi bacterium]|nr:Hsp20/alpha crystallin family protein [Chloroflexota bacterium]
MKTAPVQTIETLRLLGDDEAWPRGSGLPASWHLTRGSHLWRPPTDAYETEDAFVVVVEAAGMRGAEFSVTFERQTLWIRGSRGEAGGPKAYHQMEIAYGDFETGVYVHAPVDESAIEARYSDGFLRVILPKSPPRRIPIGPAS